MTNQNEKINESKSIVFEGFPLYSSPAMRELDGNSPVRLNPTEIIIDSENENSVSMRFNVIFNDDAYHMGLEDEDIAAVVYQTVKVSFVDGIATEIELELNQPTHKELSDSPTIDKKANPEIVAMEYVAWVKDFHQRDFNRAIGNPGVQQQLSMYLNTYIPAEMFAQLTKEEKTTLSNLVDKLDQSMAIDDSAKLFVHVSDNYAYEMTRWMNDRTMVVDLKDKRFEQQVTSLGFEITTAESDFKPIQVTLNGNLVTLVYVQRHKSEGEVNYIYVRYDTTHADYVDPTIFIQPIKLSTKQIEKIREDAKLRGLVMFAKAVNNTGHMQKLLQPKYGALIGDIFYSYQIKNSQFRRKAVELIKTMAIDGSLEVKLGNQRFGKLGILLSMFDKPWVDEDHIPDVNLNCSAKFVKDLKIN